MTDEEAKRVLYRSMESTKDLWALEDERGAIKHALQAIEDRAAIVERFVGSPCHTVLVDEARRHMRGEIP